MSNRKARTSKFFTVKYLLGSACAFALIGLFVVFYLLSSSGDGTVADEPTTPSEELHSSVITHESSDPQYPPRKLRQAWFEIPEKDADQISRPSGLPSDSIYVVLTGEHDQWLLGTPVEIPIPQTSQTYRSIVDRIAPDEMGNTTIHAKPDANEEEFLRLIVTFNGTHTFAYVSTTAGSYEMSGTEEGGWLTPSSGLHKNIDYTQKDVYETRRDRHANTKYVPPRDG